jgi:hypothetical protein
MNYLNSKQTGYEIKISASAAIQYGLSNGHLTKWELSVPFKSYLHQGQVSLIPNGSVFLTYQQFGTNRKHFPNYDLLFDDSIQHDFEWTKADEIPGKANASLFIIPGAPFPLDIRLTTFMLTPRREERTEREIISRLEAKLQSLKELTVANNKRMEQYKTPFSLFATQFDSKILTK